MNSIYDLDEKIRNLLTPDNFLGDFTVKEFVEELGKNHALPEYEVNSLEYLDPKPYIRTFEATLQELSKLEKEIEVKRKNLEQDVEKYDGEHNRIVLNLSQRIEGISSQFTELTDQVSAISSRTTPLGEKLEKVSRLRDRYKATTFLIKCYNSFLKFRTSEELDKLRKGTLSERRKCAAIVRQLLTLSRNINGIENSERCKNDINKFAEIMEKDLLEQFGAGYKDLNLGQMADASDILTDFNGGTSVVQIYVNSHEFFMDENMLNDATTVENEALWNTLSDPDIHTYVLDDDTLKLLDKLRDSLAGEARVIDQTFRDPANVLEVLLQRLYAQVIQQRLELLLTSAESTSTLAYIRTLHVAYSKIHDFTNDVKEILKNYDVTGDGRYFEREKKSLEEVFSSILWKFNEAHPQARTLKDKPLISRVSQNGHYYQSDHAVMTESGGRFTQLSQMMRKKNKLQDGENIDAKEHESALDVNDVSKMLMAVVESISRVIELTANHVAINGLALLEILIEGSGKSYIDLGLELAYTNVHQDTRTDINLFYLQTVDRVGGLLYLISNTISTVILPLAAGQAEIRKKMADTINGYLFKTESAVTILLKETIEMCLNKVTNALLKQKKKDFNAKSGDAIEDDTEACEETAWIMSVINTEARKALNGDNLERFLKEVGAGIKNLLLEHFKKFQVSPTGALVLTKDVRRYQNSIDEWGIQSLTDDYGIFREVATLFTVQYQFLPSLIQEGTLSKLKPRAIKEYITKRADSNPSYVDRMLYSTSFSNTPKVF